MVVTKFVIEILVWICLLTLQDFKTINHPALMLVTFSIGMSAAQLKDIDKRD
jgi:uncharacterized membrane protein